MSDFSISGSLDPRQILEGLKAVERGAEASGQRVGDNLLKGVRRVATEIPSSLSKAIKAAEGQAASSGSAIGTGLSAGIGKQLNTAIPSALSKALTSVNAGKNGEQLGTQLAGGVSKQVSATIPTVLNKALSSGSGAAGKAGQGLGTLLASGLNSTVSTSFPSVLSKAIGSAGSSTAASKTGQQLGTGVATALSGQVATTIPQALGKAIASGSSSSSAAKAGQQLGAGVASGLSNQANASIPSALAKAISGSSSTGAATKAGQELGSGVSTGVSQRVSSGIPTALTKAIAASGTGASSRGQQIGSELGSGIGGKLQGAVPSALQKALSSGVSSASGAGQQVGATFTGAVGTAVKGQIPPALEKALSNGASSGSKAGKQLGSNVSSSANEGLLKLLPPGFLKALGIAGDGVKSSGSQIGSGLAGTIGSGLGSTLPGQFKRIFSTSQEQAGRDGQGIGQAVGRGIGSGLDQNKALFASLISQAQKAARDVGLVFNSVKLRFETPKGEIVPQKELDKLRSLNPALDSAMGGLGRFAAAAGESGSSLSPLGNGIGSVTRQGGLMEAAVTGVAFSLANGFTNAAFGAVNAITGLVSGFAQLDTEIRRAASAAGEQGGYERLYKTVETVGIEAAGTQQEVAALATSLVRAGYTVGEVEKAMPGVVRGAEATGTAFEQMGSIVGNTLRGFGLDVKETARVTDVLVKTANASNASVEGLGYTFQYAAPVAKSLKISLEDLAAAAGLMANAGIEASTAGTGLRFGLGRLQKAAAGASGESLGLTKSQDKLTNAMRMLGAEVTKTDGTLRPLDQVFIALKGSLEKLDTASQIEMASAIFGDEAGSKFLAVTNQSEEAIRKMFTTIRNSKGATDEARGGMQGFEMSMKALEGTIGSLTNTFGQVIATGLAPFIAAANTVLGVVVAVPGPIKQLVAALALLAGGYAAVKLSAVAFGRALEQPMVAGAIKEVQVLLRYLRIEFARDVAAAIAQWKTWQAALSASSASGAVQGLQQIAQGLRNLNAQQVVAGFTQVGRTLADVSRQGVTALQGLAAQGMKVVGDGAWSAAVGAANLGKGLQGMATQSKAAETGLSGVALLLQRAMTAGANGASTALGNVSGAMVKVSALSSGGVLQGLTALAGGFGGVVVAAGPLLIALAAIVPAVVGYNVVMAESRKVTETIQPAVDASAKSLQKAGISFRNFGEQGGPLKELATSLSRNFQELSTRLKDIPVIGPLVKAAFEGIWATLKNSPLGLLIQGLTWATGAIKTMYVEAGRTQAIIESQDQMRQFGEQVDSSVASAIALTEKLKGLGSGGVQTATGLQQSFTSTRQALTDQVVIAANVASKFREMAIAARAAGDSKLAESYERQAQAADIAGKYAQVHLTKLEAQGKAAGLVKEKIDQQAESMSNLTQQLLKYNAAASGKDINLQVAQALLSYGKALADLEQSRFNVVKARGGYELQQVQERVQREIQAAQDRGASENKIKQIKLAGEAEIAAVKAKNDQVEAQALAAKFGALKQQQSIEQAVLAISQEKARVEANISVLNARIQLLRNEAELKAAIQKKDPAAVAAATQQLQLQQQIVSAENSKLGILKTLQPLERQIAEATGATALNQLQAEAAGKGWALTQGGAVVTTQQLSSTTQTVAKNVQASAVEGKRLADGTIVITQNSIAAANAVGSIGNGFKATAGQAGQVSGQMNQIAVVAKRAADGTIVISQQTRQSAQNLAAAQSKAQGMTTQLAGAVGESGDLNQAMRAAGVSLVRAADGSYKLAQNSREASSASTLTSTSVKGVERALAGAVTQSKGLSNGTKAAAGEAQRTASSAAQITGAVFSSTKGTKALAGAFTEAKGKAVEAGKTAAGIGGAAGKSAPEAAPLLKTLQLGAQEALSIAQANIAGMLSKASGSSGGLKTAMQTAASSAKSFYEWLLKASGLPGARWSGGPVDAGGQYRINELGQEAFLSASGRLSLIQKPANSVWTAPSSGVVIPAGVTSSLKERGVFTGTGDARAAVSGGGLLRSTAADQRDVASNLARQALAIGKLQQSVERLVDKDWNVQVRVRNDAGGATHLNTLNRMR